MRNGAFLGQRNLEHVLLGVLDALADGDGHLGGLAHADTDVAVAIADDDERGQAEATAALDDLGNAVDVNNALFEFGSLLCSLPV